MSHPDETQLEATCRALAAEAAGLLTFSLDQRMGAALATYTAVQSAAVDELLARHLPSRWDHDTASEAPAPIQALCGSRGGVQFGQSVAATDPDAAVLAVALIWPWNNGQTISLRIVPLSTELSDAEDEAYTKAFQSWFGI